jgi:hypothetical protein
MSTNTTLTKTATTGQIQSLSSLPPLPFQIDWSAVFELNQAAGFDYPITQEILERDLSFLTQEQQEANLLHVALWIKKEPETFNMKQWHNTSTNTYPETFEQAAHCKTTHCIAGFAQVMSGPAAFEFYPGFVGQLTLGWEASRYFFVLMRESNENEVALKYLHQVIARNS